MGRFVEMVQRTVQNATREYLVIEYASSKRGQPADRLYVPTDQLDQVTKYVGGEAPTLNKLGGSDWHKTKARARRYVRQIAADLIRLYSARMATKGHAFGPDTPWQRELEDAFAYIETPDQLSSIDEVKADMEKEVPMDRLICGDVGYGKTEIAVRAAFKAVQEDKQVAILVPTTLLVTQHYNTFSERYAPFPVTVKALSRFQTDKEAREVLEGLADGRVDVVIGTHRLLGSEVRFKDLGLVVVDEEQRFGVEHKEQLKTLRTAVDVLAMSATPIPRTLEMAVTGIREMSTLATPPEERHPVLTYVGGYEEKQVTAAIRRELLREGQVFFVHNKVSSIERAASRLRELIPEARIAVAHGQMSENRLEQVVLDFWEKRFDVLVCTTIVETGLDISNANTLVVDRADVLGLSQLHQLRGRVGRGRERAYAYFMYPPEKPLTETAHDRLMTIASHTDLGAGMQVAMKDLEIRGAGNLLGGEQSGHIEGVGFDLYVRLVGEAVADFKGEGEAQLPEIKIELPVDAHLPHDYVPGERLRLEAYKKLAAVIDEKGAHRDRGGAPRPLRRPAGAGREPARGRPAADRRADGRGRRHRHAGSHRAVRAGAAAGEPAAAPQAAVPGVDRQGGAGHDPRAAADDRAGRGEAAAGRRRCCAGQPTCFARCFLDDIGAAGARRWPLLDEGRAERRMAPRCRVARGRRPRRLQRGRRRPGPSSASVGIRLGDWRDRRIPRRAGLCAAGGPGAHPALDSIVHQAQARHLRAMEDLALVVEALEAAGVGFLVVKGPALVATCYAGPHLRSYVDLDLLVRPRYLRAAVVALAEVGFSVLDANWPVLTANEVQELRLEGPTGGALDLHWSLSPGPGDQDTAPPADRLIGRAVTRPWARSPTRFHARRILPSM